MLPPSVSLVVCSPKSVCGYTISSSLGGKGFWSSLILSGAAQATGRTMITQSLFSSAIALRPKWFNHKLTAPARWKFIWKALGKILDPIFRCAKKSKCIQTTWRLFSIVFQHFEMICIVLFSRGRRSLWYIQNEMTTCLLWVREQQMFVNSPLWKE